MTTIAWDGKTMAGDRCAYLGNLALRTTKVERFDSSDSSLLIGRSGELWLTQRLIRSVLGDASIEPDFSLLEKGYILVVEKRPIGTRVYHMNSSLEREMVEQPFIAIGSGQEMAVGAMAAGANARRAVEIVEEYGCGSDHGVDVVSFDG